MRIENSGAAAASNRAPSRKAEQDQAKDVAAAPRRDTAATQDTAAMQRVADATVRETASVSLEEAAALTSSVADAIRRRPDEAVAAQANLRPTAVAGLLA